MQTGKTPRIGAPTDTLRPAPAGVPDEMWDRTRDDAELTEWTRQDGYGSVRMRQRPDGRWVVRLDLLMQAPDGPAYEHQVLDDRSAAVAAAAAMRTQATPPS